MSTQQVKNVPSIPSHCSGRQKSKYALVAVLVLVTIATSFLLSNWAISNKSEQTLEAARKRHEILAQGKVSLISTWLEDLSKQGDRLINSEIFKIYATEVDMLEGDVSLLLSETAHELLTEQGLKNEDALMLSAQLPMMQRLLEEFVSYSGFLSGRVLDANGQTYIATDAAVSSMSRQQEALAQATRADGEIHYSTLRITPTGLVMDMFLPIFSMAGPEEERGAPVAVLMLSKLMTGKVTEFLQNLPMAGIDLTLHLVQRNAAGVQRIVPWTTEGLLSVPRPELFAEGPVSFGERISVSGESSVYSSALKMPELDWWLVVEVDSAVINGEIASYAEAIITIAVLVTLALVLLMGVFWWWGVGRENKEVADQFRMLAEQINEQKLLLDSINATIPELVAVKNSAGEYIFANDAFAAATGRPVEEIIGMDDAAVFGFDTAKRLTRTDERVRKAGETMSTEETLYLRSRKYHFHITKVPFRLEEGEDAILSVFQDNTEVVEAQEMSRRVVEHTIDALVRTIEKIDPYLGGHTRLMGAFSVEMAKRMYLSDREMATVMAGANLSQIGKMFVDPGILNKPGALTEDELAEMQRHVEYASNILRNIDFDLPVVDAIVQMNENPDGSGYPEGLTSDEIILPAKILSVANGFCAMIRPRAYRPAKSIADAISLMEELPGKFSADLLAVLKEIIYSPTGEKLLKENEPE